MRFFKGQKKRRSFQRITTVVLVLTILLGEFTDVMPLEEAETAQAATNYTIGEVGYVFSDANQYWDISEAQNGSLMAYYFADAINGNKLIIDGDGKMKNYPSFWDIGWNTPLEVIFTGNPPNIGNSAFSSLSFTSIEIPDSVTSIEDGAFQSCSSLTSIVIPDSVTSIGEGAFMNCTSLASIEIPDGVTSLPEKPSSQVVYVVEEQQYAALDFVQINPVQQQELGDLYEDMKYLIKEYRFNAPYRNMFGRGAERLKQINRLEEKQNYDNRRFMLSKMRRSLMYSKDRDIYSGAKTSGATIWESVGSGYGTWLHMVKASDVISDRNQACRDRRREQREDGTLPSLLKRHTEWWATAFYNNKYRFKMGWCFINGLIDRTLGFGTMLAANSLNAVGKVVKAPIKLLSMGFNGLSSVFHKKSAGRWIIT